MNFKIKVKKITETLPPITITETTEVRLTETLPVVTSIETVTADPKTGSETAVVEVNYIKLKEIINQ